jgi:hypothetical protein
MKTTREVKAGYRDGLATNHPLRFTPLHYMYVLVLSFPILYLHSRDVLPQHRREVHEADPVGLVQTREHPHRDLFERGELKEEKNREKVRQVRVKERKIDCFDNILTILLPDHWKDPYPNKERKARYPHDQTDLQVRCEEGDAGEPHKVEADAADRAREGARAARAQLVDQVTCIGGL